MTFECPLNEFLEHYTGDMLSMDEAYHRWLQPKWDVEREKWLKRIQTLTGNKMALQDILKTEKKSIKQAPKNQRAGKKFEDEVKAVCDLYQSLNAAYIQKFEVPTVYIPKKFSQRQGKEVGGFMARRSKTGFDFVGGVVKTKSAIFIEVKSTDSGDIPVNQEKTGVKKHQLETMLWLQSIGFDCLFLWEVRRAGEIFKLTPRDIVNMIGLDGKKLTILDCQEHKIPRMVKTRYQGQFYYDFLGVLDS